MNWSTRRPTGPPTPSPSPARLRQLTYRQLTETANALAHALIAQGAGPNRLVAVRLPRSPELIIALLGILKAGAAYLPLDPDDPAGRRQQILADAKPVTVLDHLPALTPRADPPAIRTSPRHLAYAIYTSGSTGTPKGTLIEHHSLTNLVSWHVRTCRLTRDRGSSRSHRESGVRRLDVGDLAASRRRRHVHIPERLRCRPARWSSGWWTTESPPASSRHPSRRP